MLRIVSVMALLASAMGIREELGDLASSLVEVEVEVDQEMKLVPAKISRAIRRALRMSADAMKVAEEKKGNATAASEVAKEKAEEAEKQKTQAEKTLKELEKGKDQLEQMRVDAAKAAENEKEEQKAWKEEEEKLKGLVAECANEDKALEELAQKIRELADQKREVQTRKAEKELARNEQEFVVQKAAADAAAAGGIKRAALEAQQKAAAAYEAAEKHCQEQEMKAEEAEKEEKVAKADADMAKAMYDDAVQDVQNRVASKNMVVELRDAVQAYYDEVTKMTKSMEVLIAEESAKEDGKKPYELMREDPNVKSSMIVYNKMVGVFRRLFHEERDFFELVAESNKEISENAQAAILLQCDPAEDLEMEARETNSFESLNEKCGTGLWESLELERQQFPTAADAAPTTPLPTPAAEENTEPLAEQGDQAEEQATSLKQQRSRHDPALLQVRDLDIARQIRRHGFPQ